MPLDNLMERPANSSSSTPKFDTRASSNAYYTAIDPGKLRTTLSNWLKTNGWQAAAGAPDLSTADAHAVYTNNFDLGQGRDMYAKVGACDTAGQLNAGTCDVSAVVINYRNAASACAQLFHGIERAGVVRGVGGRLHDNYPVHMQRLMQRAQLLDRNRFRRVGTQGRIREMLGIESMHMAIACA